MYFFNVWGKTIYVLLKSQSSTETHDNKICGAKNLDRLEKCWKSHTVVESILPIEGENCEERATLR